MLNAILYYTATSHRVRIFSSTRQKTGPPSAVPSLSLPLISLSALPLRHARQHVPSHGVEVVTGGEPPLLACRRAVQGVGPGIRDGLTHGVHVVVQPEVRQHLADGRRDPLGVEAHGRDVEGAAVTQPRKRF